VVAVAMANLALRFIVELFGIGFVAFWAYNASSDGVLRIVFAAVAVLAFVGVWGMFLSPRSTSGLSRPQKNVLGTVVLLVAAALLALAGQPTVAIAFAIVVLINMVLLFVLDDASERALRGFERRG
jgi:uncharacterized protein DUF2568